MHSAFQIGALAPPLAAGVHVEGDIILLMAPGNFRVALFSPIRLYKIYFTYLNCILIDSIGSVCLGKSEATDIGWMRGFVLLGRGEKIRKGRRGKKEEAEWRESGGTEEIVCT